MDEIMKYNDINDPEKIMQVVHVYVKHNHLTLQNQVVLFF